MTRGYLHSEHGVLRIALAVLKCFGHTKAESVLSCMDTASSFVIHLHELGERRVQPHPHSLPRLHMHALEAKQRLQGDAASTCLGRHHEPQYRIIGINLPRVRHIDGVLHWPGHPVPVADEVPALMRRQQLPHRRQGNGGGRGGHGDGVAEGGVRQPESEGHDGRAGVEAMRAAGIGAVGAPRRRAHGAVRARERGRAGAHREVEDGDLIGVRRGVHSLNRAPGRRHAPEQHVPDPQHGDAGLPRVQHRADLGVRKQRRNVQRHGGQEHRDHRPLCCRRHAARELQLRLCERNAHGVAALLSPRQVGAQR
mmetsp:Transcript_18545/g.32233  ORF Transcript_18545/g.32233 Transcript_18545/m.32233 type:complete len:310 (+) Transcript_18545:974-1903(+)